MFVDFAQLAFIGKLFARQCGLAEQNVYMQPVDANCLKISGGGFVIYLHCINQHSWEFAIDTWGDRSNNYADCLTCMQAAIRGYVG